MVGNLSKLPPRSIAYYTSQLQVSHWHLNKIDFMLGHSRNGRNVPLCSLELPAKNIFFGSNFEKVSVLLCQGILNDQGG